MATYYVRADANGGETGAEPTPSKAWTFAEMMTNLTSGSVAAGDTIWLVAAGGVFSRTTNTDSPTKDGTAVLPISIRGCYAAANDLDTPTYNADGTLDTTNYPSIVYTSGRWFGSGSDFVFMRTLNISGAPSNYLVYMGNNSVIMQCRIANTASNGSAWCMYTGTVGDACNCDLVGNSGTMGGLLENSGSTITGCRFKTVTSKAIACTASGSTIVGNTFFAPVGTSAIAIDHTSTNTAHELNLVANNTIVGGWDIGVRAANAANDRIMHIVNNHITGCLTAGIKTLYTTSMRAAVIAGNRMRDNGTGGNVVGYDNWYATFAGLNTTTAGTDATDFVNPSLNDYRLRANSPGATAAIGGGSAAARAASSRGGVLSRPGRAGRF